MLAEEKWPPTKGKHRAKTAAFLTGVCIGQEEGAAVDHLEGFAE